MTSTLTKSACLDQLNTTWAEWQSLLESIPDERKTEPGATGHWSVKDIIAHIAHFERWTYEWLEPALAGNPPPEDDSEEASMTIDEQNARIYERNRNRSLADIQAEAADVHARLVAAVARVPEEVLPADAAGYAPFLSSYYDPGTTVWQAIDGNAGAHYRHHIDDVREWLGR